MFRSYFFVPLSGFLISWLACFGMRWLGHKFEIIDIPSSRKIHKGSIPRAGGAAIFLGTWIPSVFFLSTHIHKLILIGGFLSLMLGLYDDIKGLSSWRKFLFQLLIGVLLASAGLQVNFVELPFIGTLKLGFFAIPFAALWISLAMNAVNLIDGLDGLCSSIVLVSALTFLAMGNEIGVVLSLAAAVVGFLLLNFQPASLFMGDGGSYFLGFMLAALSISWSQHSGQKFSVLPSLFVMGLPLIDTALAIIRRAIYKKPIFFADGGHIHHCLLKRGLSARRVVFVLTAIQSVFCGAGYVFYQGALWQMWIAAFLVIFLIGILFAEVVWKPRTASI